MLEGKTGRITMWKGRQFLCDTCTKEGGFFSRQSSHDHVRVNEVKDTFRTTRTGDLSSRIMSRLKFLLVLRYANSVENVSQPQFLCFSVSSFLSLSLLLCASFTPLFCLHDSFSRSLSLLCCFFRWKSLNFSLFCRRAISLAV